MADQQQLLEEFINVTGSDAERAQFYLEAAGWQLHVRFLDIVFSCLSPYQCTKQCLKAFLSCFESGLNRKCWLASGKPFLKISYKAFTSRLLCRKSD